jgi:hypothetical protein
MAHTRQQNGQQVSSSPTPVQTPSPWAPFAHADFAVLWTATVVSNIGTWMYNAGAGWLMTSLNPDPLIDSCTLKSCDACSKRICERYN